MCSNNNGELAASSTGRSKRGCCEANGMGQFLEKFSKSWKKPVHNTSVSPQKNRTQQQRCFSKQAKTYYKASSVQTENIGMRKWNKLSVWEMAVVFLTGCRRLKQKFLYQSLRYLSRAKRRAWKKIFEDAILIYVTPDQHFTTKFREIFQRNQTHAYFWSQIETLVRRAWHEILAATAQLRCFLRDTRVWNVSRNLWQRNKSPPTDKSFLHLPRVFHVTRSKVVPVKKGTETRINIKVNAQRRSLKAILLLFMEGYTGGARDSEKYVFPDLTKVSVTINGSPNMIYNNGIEGKDMWEEPTASLWKKKIKPSTWICQSFTLIISSGLLLICTPWRPKQCTAAASALWKVQTESSWKLSGAPKAQATWTVIYSSSPTPSST